ncbi:MAG: hypothetical protein KAH25_06450, partial [Bacteroidales bacterium]|nr:hypothetical protein [Bacteroidales bacterium]
MKKITLIIAAVFMMSFVSQAQHVFEKGDIAINAGLGLGGYGGFMPSLEASVEFGVIPTGDVGLVSFGGVVGWKHTTESYYYSYWNGGDDWNYSYNQFIFGGRATWHLHTFTSDKWDAYAGLGLGMKIWQTYDHWDHNANEGVLNSHSGVYEEFFVGGRMMFSSSFGMFAEVGYSRLSNARIG